MVDWQNPLVELNEYLSLTKLIHVLGGLYIWELCITARFDWEFITGKRPYRWTALLYFGCRFSGLFAIIALFVGFDVTSPINCQLWVVFVYVLAYLTAAFASALIVLRIVAIWERDLYVTTFALVTWVASVAFYIHSIAITHAVWNPIAGACQVLDTVRSRENILATLVSDIILLVLMLWGLLRWRNAVVAGHIWSLLYKQGLWWVVVVTLAEVPPVVFILLNLNDSMNQMFQVPEVIIMAIGAMRIYRGLYDYAHDNSTGDLSQSTRRQPSSGGIGINVHVRRQVDEATDGAPAFSMRTFERKTRKTTKRASVDPGPDHADAKPVSLVVDDLEKGRL